jgi:hypothetical protein
VSAAGGLLSLLSSVGGTGVSSSTVSISSESAFVPDASGAVTVRSGDQGSLKRAGQGFRSSPPETSDRGADGRVQDVECRLLPTTAIGVMGLTRAGAQGVPPSRTPHGTPVCMSGCDSSLPSERVAVSSSWGEGKGFIFDFGMFYINAMSWGNSKCRRTPELPMKMPSCKARVPPAVAFRPSNPLCCLQVCIERYAEWFRHVQVPVEDQTRPASCVRCATIRWRRRVCLPPTTMATSSCGRTEMPCAVPTVLTGLTSGTATSTPPATSSNCSLPD